MNLIEVQKAFASDDLCLNYFEQMRWPDGVRCPVCGCKEISRVTRKAQSKNKRNRFYQCLEKTCRQQFSATSGTLFHDSHLPISKWFLAIALMVDAKKGISANQLKRHLGINYRTAWYLNHRIREAMQDGTLAKLGGIVEVDETYIGGKARGKGTGQGRYNKQTVFGVRQRSGELRFVQVKKGNAETAKQIIETHVSPDVELLMTDDSTIYPAALKTMDAELKAKHRTINHIRKKYVEGIVHTNTVESAFSLLKRGIIGSFHKVSIKHLQRYLNEFQYRFNRRDKQEMLFAETVRRMMGAGVLSYQELIAEKN